MSFLLGLWSTSLSTGLSEEEAAFRHLGAKLNPCDFFLTFSKNRKLYTKYHNYEKQIHVSTWVTLVLSGRTCISWFFFFFFSFPEFFSHLALESRFRLDLGLPLFRRNDSYYAR